MQDEISDNVEPPPEEIFLPPSRGRWIFTLIVSLLMIGLDLYLAIAQGAAAVWLLVILFTITAALAISQLIPGGAGLWLDRDGFTYRMFWVDRRRRWADITPVAGSQVGFLQLVGYHKLGEPTTKPREVLPDTYGMGAYELAELMNHWRENAVKGTASS